MKKQNGITLVALVITIIILLILAGVTLSIVFNGGIIDKSQNAVDSYEYSSKNEDEKLNDLEARFTQLYNERVAGKEENSTPQWEIVTDYGNDGLSIGDLIAPTVTGVTGERFYVIDNTEGTVTLLAEKCVNTTNNEQSSSASEIAFDVGETITEDLGLGTHHTYTVTTNVYANSSIKGYVDEYASKLTTAGLTLEDVEIVENGSTVTGTKGRLIWGTDSSGEIQEILNSSLTNKSDIVYGPTGAKLNYWLGSKYAEGNNVYLVLTTWGGQVNYCPSNDSTCWGACSLCLRPVIKVLSSKISAT